VRLLASSLLLALWALPAVGESNAQALAEQEISRLGQIPRVSLVSDRSYHRPNTVLATRMFVGAHAFSEIRSFYDDAFSKAGWRFAGERSVQDWWRDFGGKSVTYCKAGYVASVEYAGTTAQYGWNFSVSVQLAGPTECRG
jgi:hypothetical protein